MPGCQRRRPARSAPATVRYETTGIDGVLDDVPDEPLRELPPYVFDDVSPPLLELELELDDRLPL